MAAGRIGFALSKIVVSKITSDMGPFLNRRPSRPLVDSSCRRRGN
jgi:hypothetical protein